MLLTTRSFKTFNFKKTWSASESLLSEVSTTAGISKQSFSRSFPTAFLSSLIAYGFWPCVSQALQGRWSGGVFWGHGPSQNIIRPPQTGWLDILITGNGLELVTESISRGFPVLEATGNDLMDLMLFRTTFWPSWQSLTSPKRWASFSAPSLLAETARYLADHCAVARFTGSAYEKISERYQAPLGWDFWRAGCHLEGAFFSWRRFSILMVEKLG